MARQGLILPAIERPKMTSRISGENRITGIHKRNSGIQSGIERQCGVWM